MNNKINDEILYQAKRHWSYGLLAKVWGVFISIGLFNPEGGVATPFAILLLATPTIITLLKQKVLLGQ